jgi:hypothetical protein
VPWMVVHPTLNEVESSNCALNNAHLALPKFQKNSCFFVVGLGGEIFMSMISLPTIR